MKPIDYPAFLKAAQKAQARISAILGDAPQVDSNDDFLFVRSEYKIVCIKLENIRYIEGMREYVRIHLKGDKPLMALLSLMSLESQLSEHSFMWVHRSYIVNLNQITTIERNRIVFDEKVYIPVSDQY
ncbi:MAG: LytTR family transcriptional regulator [Saprospiraceae bacterium]|nr:LytTR family transcriptional regulator [Saprospiraceae bacterium]